MIKEYCMTCGGRGTFPLRPDTKRISDLLCESCQGKGYTELEPIFNARFKKKDHELMKEFFTGYEDEKLLVYLKVKESKGE